MLRYRLSFLVVICVVFAWGTVQVMAGETNSTTVAVSIAPSIAVVAWPEGFLIMDTDVVPGQEVMSSVLEISVKANSSWGIQISGDSPDGRMREFDLGTGSYVSSGALLTHPLQWALYPSESWQALSSTPSSIVAGQPPTDNNGETVRFRLRFVADYGDRPLEEGRDYRVTLQYTAGLNF